MMRPARRHVVSALAATTVGVLPVYLFGGMAPLVRADLGFDERWIGAGASLFFAVSALTSVHGGKLGERLGSRRGMWVGIAASCASLGGIALLAVDWWWLAVFLALGGYANAVTQPAANLALARGVPERRRGLAFGFKQAAIPAASALAGFTVPVLGVTVGWRPAFLAAAGLALLVALLPGRDADAADGGRPRGRMDRLPRSLLLLTVGVGFGTAAANSMAAYLVEAGVTGGLSPSIAGLVLGVGSALGIVARVAIGWVSDRMRGGYLTFVAGLLFAGSIGYVALARLDVWPLLVLGVVLAFVGGWGFNGLYLYAVVRLHPEAPAASTGLAGVGAFTGAVIGPPVFGLVAFATTYAVAWTMIAGSSLVGGLLVLGAARLARAEHRAARR